MVRTYVGDRKRRGRPDRPGAARRRLLELRASAASAPTSAVDAPRPPRPASPNAVPISSGEGQVIVGQRDRQLTVREGRAHAVVAG